MNLLKGLGKLRWQLMLSYLPLVLVPVLLVGLVTRSVAEQGVTLLVTEGLKQQARLISECFGQYYQVNGSWQGLTALLKRPALDRANLAKSASAGSNSGISITIMRGPGFAVGVQCFPLTQSRLSGILSLLHPQPQLAPSTTSGGTDQQNFSPADTDHDGIPPFGLSMRDFFRGAETLITDPNGIVVASNDERNIGQSLGVNVLASGAPIVVDDKIVGILIIGRALGALDPQQRQVLDAVNGALVLSGAVSIVLAVGLGWGLSWRISFPVRQLMEGVKRLSRGEWTGPLEGRSNNEFGELTDAFNTMAAEVTRQQQLSRQMVADIAHDLRTPLSAMSLEVEAIEAGFQTPAEATDSLREEITFLQRLVDDLRLLSLMDADQIRLQVEDTPLYPFMSGVYDFWQILASEGERSLKLDAPQDLPDGTFDPSRIRQVLGNLIDNAIRHTRPGGKITLGARAEADSITLWVADDGEGIPPEDLPHVFDRFYRADPSRSRNNTGSGLGLSISRRLVEMHSGSISVTSKLGHGARFTIRLPRRATEPNDPTKWVRHLDGRHPVTPQPHPGTLAGPANETLG